MKVDSDKIRDLMGERSFSQTELARLSSVSRATIVKLLNPSGGSVHRSTVARIADVFGVEVAVLDCEGVETEYRKSVADKCSLLRFTGLGMVSSGTPLPLERGFAAPLLRTRPDNESYREDRPRAGRPGTAPSVVDGTRHSREPISVGSALDRSRWNVFLGDPGSGKTTVLRHLALSYAQRLHKERGYPDKPLIPIFVRLADWVAQLQDDETTDAIDAALARLQMAEPAGTAGWLREQSKQGSVIFLLDGLDEVADPEDQGLLLDRIRELVKSYPEAHVLISSRTVGFNAPKLGKRFDTHEIQNLAVPEIRQFAAAWCAHRHGHRSDKKCADCERSLGQLDLAIIKHPRIRVLAGNPMMLTILCLLHDAGAALPQRRWQLFDKICEALLFSWQENKRTSSAGAPDKALDLEDREILWLLGSLALEMQRKDRTLVPRWWLSDMVGRFLRDDLGYAADEARARADSVIWSLEHRSGMLRERGAGRFGFWHLALQEHFAARAVLEEPDPIEAIRPYLYHPRWREVVRLAAARLDLRSAPKLLRLVLDDPDPAGRFLHRGLLLALGCLADGAPVHDAALLSQVAGEVEELGTSRWLGIAMDAFDSLAELQSTRLAAYASDACGKLLAAASESLSQQESELLGIVATTAGLIGESPEGPPTDQPSGDSTPAVEIDNRKAIGESILHIIVNRPKQIDKKRMADILQVLRDADSKPVRITCAEMFSHYAGRQENVAKALMEALDHEKQPSVRVAIIRALEDAASRRSVRSKLLDYLDLEEEEDEVRGASAIALGVAVSHDRKIRDRLVLILQSDAGPEFREGAAYGLAGRAGDDAKVRELLRERMTDTTEDDEVRSVCLRVLEDVLPSMQQALETVCGFLSESSGDKLPRIAAAVLASHASSGQVDWHKLPIEQIERVLVSIEQPCQGFLDAIRGLVDARELRKLGVPREKRIAAALSAVRDRVDRAFIYGSAARGEQGEDSDIDLMVIGDVSLRELTPGLRKAEQELSRQINVVVYSPQEWEDRKRMKNPFVMEVSSGKTVEVLGESRESSTMAR